MGRGEGGRRPRGASPDAWRPGRRNGLLALALALCLTAGAGTAHGAVRADFDGNGAADLAVGAQHDAPEGIDKAGSVSVLYATDRLHTAGNQLWHQDVSGVPGRAEEGDLFGVAVAAGDFNGDELADLAIGVPGEDLGDTRDAGVVNVLYGDSKGLSAAAAEIVFDEPGELGDTPRRAGVGRALAVGDFNGDGLDDLAAGGPLYDHAAGRLHVAYGSATGLGKGEAIRQCVIDPEDHPACELYSEGFEDAAFGYALAAGDLDGDGHGDLAIGAPGENTMRPNAGAVTVRYGDPGGLAAGRGQFFYEDDHMIDNAPAANDHFGAALAIGDFDAGGSADLAVGAPGARRAGMVFAMYGLPRIGLIEEPWAVQPLWQGSDGIEGAPEPGDQFGFALTTGDFRADGAADLAIGAPGEDVPAGRRNTSKAGWVTVIDGAARDGLRFRTHAWAFDQSLMGHREGLEPGDAFGAALGADDFNRDGRDDLSIGVPFENIRRGGLSDAPRGQIRDAGLVTVLDGWEESPLDDPRSFTVHQDTPGMTGHARVGDNFASGLTR